VTDTPDGPGALDGDVLFRGVDRVCEYAARLADADSVTATLIASPNQMELMYATNDLGERVDELQFLTGEGPCLDAHRDNTPHSYPDITTDPAIAQWPGFAAAATDLGVRAVHAFPIPDRRKPLGVLELTHRSPQRMNPLHHQVAVSCASAISAIVHANLHATGADDVIANGPACARMPFHIATGMISVQLACTVDDAADLLRAHTYAHGKSIRATSEDVISRRLRFGYDGEITTQKR
jgi:GAF domain-containing protein